LRHKHQRNHEELKKKEESSTVCSRGDQQVYMTLKAAQDKVTPEDLWKSTKTVLLEVARETSGLDASSCKRKTDT